MPVSNSNPINNYSGNGSVTSFAYTFRIIVAADIKVYFDGVLQTTGYSVTGVNNSTGGSVVFVVAPATGVVVRLQRDVNKDRTTDYVEGGALASLTLDNDFDRAVMQIQDLNYVSFKETSDGKLDAGSRIIKNVLDPVSPQDVATKSWAETGATSFVNAAQVQAGIATVQATNAAASALSASDSATTATTQAGIATTQATTATTQAGIATVQASGASGSATTATTQAGIATTQAGIATTQATAASGSALSAAASFSNLDTRYLGSKVTAPVVDNFGGVLQVGSLYFNTTNNQMNVWNGINWVVSYLPVAAYALLDSPALTGIPTAPTATAGTSTLQLATTAFVTTGLATKQNTIGYTPIQQGGGIGQSSNVVKIGWNGTNLLATVDATNLGDFMFSNRTVAKTSTTGSAQLPAGTTAQRDASPVFGSTRANSTLTQTEWWNGTAWVPMGGGATGAPGNYGFFENDMTITANYTLTAGKNAMTAGPITINTGVVVTVPAGATWSVI